MERMNGSRWRLTVDAIKAFSMDSAASCPLRRFNEFFNKYFKWKWFNFKSLNSPIDLVKGNLLVWQGLWLINGCNKHGAYFPDNEALIGRAAIYQLGAGPKINQWTLRLFIWHNQTGCSLSLSLSVSLRSFNFSLHHRPRSKWVVFHFKKSTHRLPLPVKDPAEFNWSRDRIQFIETSDFIWLNFLFKKWSV